MPRILTTAVAAAAALSFAAPAFAQDTTATMSSDYPWCSGTVADHCRQHEGMSGTMMHHGWSKHHKTAKHHRRTMKWHHVVRTAPAPQHM